MLLLTLQTLSEHLLVSAGHTHPEQELFVVQMVCKRHTGSSLAGIRKSHGVHSLPWMQESRAASPVAACDWLAVPGGPA